MLIEGLTPRGSRRTDKEVAELRAQNEKVRGHAPELDKQLDERLKDHERQLLPFGATARLEIRGVVEVLPLEDAAMLEQARHITAYGQVRRALASGPVVLITLGASHDLIAAVHWLPSWAMKNGQTQ